MNARADGFTLVEILIVTLLGSLVMASIYQMINIQDRTTRQQYAMIQNNQNARMALSVLSSDLKEISARDGDVTYADSTILEFRALRKAGVACNKDAGNSYIDVMELGDAFAAGDSVLVFADGTSTGSARDDGWLRLQVSSVGNGVCAQNALAAANIRRLNFAATPLATVFAGALVRSFTRTRYSLTDSGEFGQIQRQEGAAAAIPVIDGLATTAEGGLHIRYIDSTSTVIPYTGLRSGGARLSHIMRMQIKVRGKSPTQVAKTGANRFTDSLVTQVYVRGNARSR